MSDERWERVREAFDQAVEAGPDERADLLARLRREDPELTAEVEALLEADAEAGDFLETPPPVPAGLLARGPPDLLSRGPADLLSREPPDLLSREPADLAADEPVGPYRVLRELGRGGMGAVYLAERADGAFEQRVAIKVLRRGRDAGDLAARFLAERQILASMKHPGIARLLDGGTAADGRPYLVMEYVEGEPITDWCEARGLTVEERIELFVRVCRAVGHAHHKLLVHRDLKSSNILVTESGQPKLLDFGIAKLLEGSELPGSSPPTRTGRHLMTPECASPEQVRGDPVTTASDVYQLGLLLYDLLAGVPPYRLAGRSPAEVERIVCETRPPPPSERVDGPLRRKLAGDLDTIVSVALRKTPERRYDSADRLADDLERWLEGRPVSARADSRLYRASRFVRRHRVGMAAAAVVVVLLAALAVLSLLLLESPGYAGDDEGVLEIRSLAVLPLQDLSGDPGREYFAAGMTEALIAELGRIEELTVISRTSAMHYQDTDRLLPEIGRELGVDALIEGSVLQAGDEVRITLQLVHASTDRHLWAESYREPLSDVLDLQRRVARSVAEEVQVSLDPRERERLAKEARSPDPRAYDAYLKGRYHTERLGEEALRKALAHLREAVALDSTFALAHAALAEACSMPAVLGEVTSVEECGVWARRAVELDDDLAEAHAALGTARMLAWEWEASERAFRRALELNPSSVMARQWYAELLRRTMRPEEALVQIRRAEELDPLNLLVRTMVGWPLFSQRRYEEAMAQWDEVLAMDPDYGLAIYNRGLAHWMMERPDEVLEAARSAGRRFGDEATVVRVLRAAGHALAGDRVRARDMLARVEASPGRDRPGLMAAAYLTLGLEKEALRWIETGFTSRDPWLPNTTSEPLLDGLRGHPRFRELMERMGQAPAVRAAS